MKKLIKWCCYVVICCCLLTALFLYGDATQEGYKFCCDLYNTAIVSGIILMVVA